VYKLHVYVMVEDLGLSAGQRSTIVDALKALAPNLDRAQPAERNHWRTRADGRALLLEADFDDATITAAAIRARLAALFSVSASSIGMVTTASTHRTLPSEVVTYSYGGSGRLRLVVFGGRDASRGESGTEARAFLAANAAGWGADNA
jgi:hypothetical protein